MPGFLRQLSSGLRDLGLSRTAAALSFTTLVAMVPLATVVVATVARFPVFDVWIGALEKFLLRHMLPGSASAIVHTYILGFADRASQLRGVSLAVIVLTAILLFAMVEREMNVIFRVSRPRSLTRRVPIYVLGLIAGPVLIGASIWLSTWIMAQSRAIIPRDTPFGEWFVAPLPIVLTAIALALMYKFVPARPVRWTPAIIGGVIASIAFEIMKHGFAWYLGHVGTYEVIYGTLAALPVFLVWLHLCWTIVLAGALLASALGG